MGLFRDRMARDDNGEDERSIRNPGGEAISSSHSTFLHLGKLASNGTRDTSGHRTAIGSCQHFFYMCVQTTQPRSLVRIVPAKACNIDDMVAGNWLNASTIQTCSVVRVLPIRSICHEASGSICCLRIAGDRVPVGCSA